MRVHHNVSVSTPCLHIRGIIPTTRVPPYTAHITFLPPLLYTSLRCRLQCTHLCVAWMCVFSPAPAGSRVRGGALLRAPGRERAHFAHLDAGPRNSEVQRSAAKCVLHTRTRSCEAMSPPHLSTSASELHTFKLLLFLRGVCALC